MIHQIATENLKLKTPAYSIPSRNSNRSYHTNRKFRTSSSAEYSVTKARQLSLTNASVKTKFSKINVDILGYVEGIPFVVYITHKGRPIPIELDPPSVEKCGIIAIDLTRLPALFEQEKHGRYLDALRRFMEQDSRGKQWIYHPRAAKVREAAELREATTLREAEKIKLERLPHINTRKSASISNGNKVEHYQCVLCKTQWRSSTPDCQKCGTHLFTKVNREPKTHS